MVACQHLLDPQAKMFELITKQGIPKENIHIFGKIYSTNNEVLRELLSENFKVSVPVFNPTISFDEAHAENCKLEFTHFLSSIHTPSKIIVLDDGGALLATVNDTFTSIPSHISIVGIEQTSSGFRKLEHTQLHFPIFNVARSAIKLVKESPLISKLGTERLKEVCDQYSILEPRILVVGLGPIGQTMVSALKAQGYFVTGHDIAHQDSSELLEILTENNINIIVGATGSSVLTSTQIEEINTTITQNLYLVSMSSADREFPATFIRSKGIGGNEIHSDIAWENITLINNGFPITFKGNRHESTPQEIEKTIGLLYGSVLQAITTDTSSTGFIDVPTTVTDILEKHE